MSPFRILISIGTLTFGISAAGNLGLADIGSFFGKPPEIVASYIVNVGWQMTRARFDRHGNASDSESFQEAWKLEILSDNQAFLATRRQRVPVSLEFDATQSTVGKAPLKPNAVTLSRSDMALLLGVQSLLETAGVTEVQKFEGESIRLAIGDPKLAQPVAFNGPSDEHVAIRLAVGELK